MTDDERRLLSAVTALAEREGRVVRLMIVPGANVFDSVVETALRLESSEIHVGESETLSADDQARLLGEAWERASKPPGVGVRLVVHHPRGSAAAYHLGAHAPALGPEDFDTYSPALARRRQSRWPSRAPSRCGARSADTYGTRTERPNRDAALQMVRDTVRPADEIAAVIRAARLRPAARHAAQPPAERSRIGARPTCRSMSRCSSSGSCRARPPPTRSSICRRTNRTRCSRRWRRRTPRAAQRHGAGRSHDVPRGAAGERHPPAARAADAGGARGRRDAARLPRGIDRPSDDAALHRVREDWTVAQVLDHIRAHGQNSETLNVIYVVDEKGVLIDDIRIREFLLTPRDQHGQQPDGPPVRRAEGHRRSGNRRPRVPRRGSLGAAGHRHGGRAHRHRHRGRRARRRGGRRRPKTSSGSADRKRSTSRTWRSRSADGAEARRLAHRAVPGRDADRDGDGLLRERDREGGRPGAVRPAHHLERRQLRLAGLARSSSARWRSAK